MNKRLNVLLQEVSNDEDATTDDRTGMPEDLKQPWLTEFYKYLNIIEQVPDDCSAVGW